MNILARFDSKDASILTECIQQIVTIHEKNQQYDPIRIKGRNYWFHEFSVKDRYGSGTLIGEVFVTVQQIKGGISISAYLQKENG